MPYCHYHQREEEKLCKAHIIPKCFYDKEAFFCLYSANGTTDSKHYQNGAKDSNILCSKADGILGEYDKEAYNILIRDIEKHKIKNKNIYQYLAHEFNYEKLRFFFISLVWRASISQLDCFKNINLKQYENIALKILKKEIANDDKLFNTLIFKKQHNEDNHILNNTMFASRIRDKIPEAFVFNFNDLCILISPEYNKFYNCYQSLNPEYINIYEATSDMFHIKKTCIEALISHNQHNKGA